MKKELKKFIGKNLLSIIDLDTRNEYIQKSLGKITNDNYSSIENAKLLLFDDGNALIFVDFDDDGYRSGNWNLISVNEFLDKGGTIGIKHINSKVIDIEFKNSFGQEFVLITTLGYIISMGQDNTDSYYPRNFFNISECKEFILGKKMKLLK